MSLNYILYLELNAGNFAYYVQIRLSTESSSVNSVDNFEFTLKTNTSNYLH